MLRSTATTSASSTKSPDKMSLFRMPVVVLSPLANSSLLVANNNSQHLPVTRNHPHPPPAIDQKQQHEQEEEEEEAVDVKPSVAELCQAGASGKVKQIVELVEARMKTTTADPAGTTSLLHNLSVISSASATATPGRSLRSATAASHNRLAATASKAAGDCHTTARRHQPLVGHQRHRSAALPSAPPPPCDGDGRECARHAVCCLDGGGRQSQELRQVPRAQRVHDHHTGCQQDDHSDSGSRHSPQRPRRREAQTRAARLQGAQGAKASARAR